MAVVVPMWKLPLQMFMILVRLLSLNYWRKVCFWSFFIGNRTEKIWLRRTATDLFPIGFWDQTWTETKELFFQWLFGSLEIYCRSLEGCSFFFVGGVHPIIFADLFTCPVDNGRHGLPSLKCLLCSSWDRLGVVGPGVVLPARSWRCCCWAGSVGEQAWWVWALGGGLHYLWSC